MITAELKIQKMSNKLKHLLENCQDPVCISYDANNQIVSIKNSTDTDIYGIVDLFGLVAGIGGNCEIQEMHIDYFHEMP